MGAVVRTVAPARRSMGALSLAVPGPRPCCAQARVDVDMCAVPQARSIMGPLGWRLLRGAARTGCFWSDL